jgi:hypothetical protein
MNIQTGQEEIEETDAEFAIGLAALQRFVAREGHAQVPANHTEERITATERIPLSKFARFHTPGPWTVDEDRDSNRADDGSMQTIIDANDGDGWVTLAIMGGNFPESLEANARLIAAAPALEDALALLADLVGGMNVDGIEGTTTIGGQYATTVVSALEAARAALEAAAPAATADA